MDDDSTLGGSHSRSEHDQASRQRDLESWKHFAGMGGTDKNTMIVTVSWLLGLAAGAIGYVVSHMIGSTAARLENPLGIAAVSVLGLLLSLFAAYVALLYAGYANRNWAQADMIARKRGWLDLLPEGCTGETTKRKWVAAAAWRLSRPSDPERKLAPVFLVFSFLAIFSSLAHLFFLVWALYTAATPSLRTALLL